MSRTINEIYNEMISEKEQKRFLNELQPNIDSGQNLLNDLTTSSRLQFGVCIFTSSPLLFGHTKNCLTFIPRK